MKFYRMLLPLFAAALAGCASIGRVVHPPLRVGVSPQFPPLVFMESNQLAGVEADFARALGKKLGREVRFVTLKWNDQIPTLLVNETDIIMSGMTVAAGRSAKAAFTTPYLTNSLRAVARAGDAAKFTAAMADTSVVHTISAKIGFLEGATAEAMVKHEYPKSTFVELRNRPAAFARLKAGEIDWFVDEGYVLAEHPPQAESGLVILPQPVANAPLAWAVRPGAVEFLADINGILKRWIADGTRDRIVKRWLPDLNTAPR